MQEARWEEAVDILERRVEALANPTERVDVLMQAASLWADKIGDGGSAAQVYERVLQIDPGHQTASLELEQLYRQRKSWMKLVDLLLARTEFAPDAPARIALLVQVAEIYEQQLDDRDSAFVTLQAAFREDYSNDHVAEELRAPGHRGRQVERADRRLHPGGAGDRRSQAGGRSVGEDRALVRLGAPPRRLRHRLGAAGAAARQRARRRAAGAGGLLPQAEALERPGHRAGPPRRVSRRSRRRGSTSSCSWPTPTRRRSATPRRR